MSTLVLRRPALRTWAFDVATPAAAPAVSLERDGEDGVLVAEAPGLDPARDLSVQVTGDRLVVAGTRRQVSGGVHREARFSRAVRLPDHLGADAVSARYDAGVLRVRVAGMFPAPVQPQTVTVTIASDVAPAQPAEQTEQKTEQQTEQQTEQPAA